MLKMGAIALVSVTALAGCSADGGDSDGGGATDQPVVVASWGGTFDEGLQQAYFDAFTEETGIEVVIATADTARFIAMNEAGASEWNSIDSGGPLISDWAEEGYLDELPEGVSRSDLVENDVVADHVAGAYLNSFVIVYREDAYPEAPQGWADFWDVEKFPGKRAISNYYEGIAEAAVLADGVTPEDVYPLDLDRAFEKLDELKPNITVVDGFAALRQAIQTGQVDMALLPSGSAATSVMDTPGLAISWEQNILSVGGFPISSTGPNPGGYAQLVEFMQDPERQAEFTNISFYGSAMSEAAEFIDPEILPYTTTYEENFNKAVKPDYEWLADNVDEYVDRFSEWLAQ